MKKSKQIVSDMVEDVRIAYIQMIKSAKWLDEKSKKVKLTNFSYALLT